MSPPGAGVGAGGPSPNPECRPRKEQGLPPGPLATGFFFLFFPLASFLLSDQARPVELKRFLRPFPEGEGPRPDSRQSQERRWGWEAGTEHKGEVRRRAGERKQEEPQSCRPPPQAWTRLPRPLPLPRRPPKPSRQARENRIQITYNGIVSCAGTAQSLPPRNRRHCRPGHDPLRREGGGRGPALALGPTPLPHPLPPL